MTDTVLSQATLVTVATVTTVASCPETWRAAADSRLQPAHWTETIRTVATATHWGCFIPWNGSSAEQEILRVEQTPHDVFQFHAPVFGGSQSGQEAVEFFLGRPPGQS